MKTTPSSEQLQVAKKIIDESKHITVLTGAGISTDSGIPDYRGPDGVWTKDPEAEKLSDIRYYLNDPEVRKRSWEALRKSPILDAMPNEGHQAITRLYWMPSAHDGKLVAVITQNIDGLHSKHSGFYHGLIDYERVIELHGSDEYVICTRHCGFRMKTLEVIGLLRWGVEDIMCPKCSSNNDIVPLRRDVVYFGEELDGAKWDLAEAAIAKSDALLIVGTTLQVAPVSYLPFPAYENPNCAVIIVNGSPTHGDEYADVVLRGDISTILNAIIEADRQEPSTEQRDV